MCDKVIWLFVFKSWLINIWIFIGLGEDKRCVSAVMMQCYQDWYAVIMSSLFRVHYISYAHYLMSMIYLCFCHGSLCNCFYPCKQWWLKHFILLELIMLTINLAIFIKLQWREQMHTFVDLYNQCRLNLVCRSRKWSRRVRGKTWFISAPASAASNTVTCSTYCQW